MQQRGTIVDDGLERKTMQHIRWRTARVFISSTFRDMHAERDYLVKYVFPELRTILEKKKIHFVDIDLRWGITEEESRQGHVMEICREEVDNCRPFFLCFLGERYGWIPPGENISITEMEIERGALVPAIGKDKSSIQAFFYFRNSDYVSKLEFPEQREIYLDLDHQGNPDKVAREKLDRLKSKIQSSGYPVFCYPCEWNDTLTTAENREPQKSEEYNAKCSKGRLMGFEVLGQRVKQDILAAVQSVFPESEAMADPLLEERALHEAFSERLSRLYIGRQEQKQALTDYVRSGGVRPAVIVGEPGSGKSAFLATWQKEYSLTYPDDYTLIHFIGASQDSGRADKLLSRLCQEIQREFSLQVEIPTKIEELTKTLQDMLFQVSQVGRRVVLAIDALNQIEPVADAHLLGWIPQAFPKNVSLVVSTLPGISLDAMKRMGAKEFSLPSLTREDCEKITKEALRIHGKELSHEQGSLFLGNPGTHIPLFLKVALEELRVFGAYQQLTDRIRSLATDVPQLFGQVLSRLEEEQGKALVERLMTLLACSRYGLRETEILTLGGNFPNPLPAAVWARLCQALRLYLVQKSGLYGFFHAQLEEAVRSRYLSSPEKTKQTHRDLAKFFASANNERKVPELPYQLQHAEEWEELAVLLSDLDFFELMTPDRSLPASKQQFMEPDWDFIEVMRYWVAIGKRHSLVERYTRALKAREKKQGKTEGIVYTIDRVGALFDKTGHYDAALLLEEKSLAIKLKTLGPDHPAVAISYGDLGLVYKRKGQYDKAVAFHEKSLAIRLKTLGPDHPDVANSYGNLGSVYQRKGEYDKAIEFYEKSLAIRLKSIGTEQDVDVAISYGNLGSIYQRKGEYDKAIELCEKSLAVKLKTLGPDHPSVGTSYGNLAIAYQNKGEYDRAIELYEQSLAIKLKTLAPEHPDVAMSYSGLGMVYAKKGEYDRAVEFHEKDLAISLKAFGNEHPYVASAYNNLGMAYDNKGECDKGREFLEKSLAMKLKLLTPEHASVADSYNNLGNFYDKKGDYKKAIEFHEKSLKIRRKAVGANHPDTIATQKALEKSRKAHDKTKGKGLLIGWLKSLLRKLTAFQLCL